MSCTPPPNVAPTRIHKCSGQETELRREHRADERAGTGDGGEMMTKRHPAIGRDEILAVIHHQRGRGAVVVEHENFCRKPLAVKAITDRGRAKTRGHDPERVDRLAPGKGQHGDRRRTEQTDADPEKEFEQSGHVTRATITRRALRRQSRRDVLPLVPGRAEALRLRFPTLTSRAFARAARDAPQNPFPAADARLRLRPARWRRNFGSPISFAPSPTRLRPSRSPCQGAAARRRDRSSLRAADKVRRAA